MGKLIKNHWARLIVLTAAVIQIAASIEGFIWPKIFWDFSTNIFDPLVKPIPFLQIFNIIVALAVFSLEWPVPYLAGSLLHRNIIARVLLYPLCSLPATLMYQSTNAAAAYLVGTGIYAWGMYEKETIPATPWTISEEKSEV